MLLASYSSLIVILFWNFSDIANLSIIQQRNNKQNGAKNKFVYYSVNQAVLEFLDGKELQQK